jgi:hypothetical protein
MIPENEYYSLDELEALIIALYNARDEDNNKKLINYPKAIFCLLSEIKRLNIKVMALERKTRN